MLVLLTVSLLCCGAAAVIHDLSDADFARMPDVFNLDDYNSCMLRSDGVFCLLTLELQSEPNNKLYKQIQEYSEYYFTHYNHSIIESGVCIYKTCETYFNATNSSEKDLIPILEVCLNRSIWNRYGLNAKVLKMYRCSKNNVDAEITHQDLITIFIVFGILVINLIGSLYHYFLRKYDVEEENTSYLISFSIFQNWKDLFKEEPEKSKIVTLRGLHGSRTLISIIFLYCHSLLTITSFTHHVHHLERFFDYPWWRIFSHGLNIIQINFLISGFLMAYKIREFELEKTMTMSFKDLPKFLLIRFIRLSPSYVIVILLTRSWARHFGSGPLLSYYFEDIISNFHEFFWKHLFYFNNYMSEPIKSLSHTWYVAADTQLFVVGVAVLAACRRRRGRALAALLALGLACLLADLWLKDVQPITFANPEFIRNLNSKTVITSHMRGHNHLISFVPGMIMGLLIFEWQKEQRPIHKLVLPVSGFWSVPAMICLIQSVKLFYDAVGLHLSLTSKLLIAVGYRIVMLTILMIGIISVITNIQHSAWARLWAWDGWRVPSRLGYGVYLTHAVLIHVIVSSRTTTTDFSVLQGVLNFVGVTVCSHFLATLLYILVEAPCKMLLRRAFMKHSRQSSVNEKQK